MSHCNDKKFPCFVSFYKDTYNKDIKKTWMEKSVFLCENKGLCADFCRNGCCTCRAGAPQ